MEKDILLKMIETPSPSGAEFHMQNQIKQYFEQHADDVLTDVVGNVVGVLNPQSETKIMLAGHIDEIALMVSHITDAGMLKVTNAGGVRPALYLGSKVRVLSAKGELFGAVGVNADLLKNKELTCADLFIDLGATSKEEAERYVSVGDYVIMDTTSVPLINNYLSGRALDNRLGAFIVMQSLRRAKEMNAKVGVYAATTVGEETTMRGAHYATQLVKPTMAIAVDVTYATDYPGTSPHVTGDVHLGKGPVLCHSSIVNNPMNERLKEVATTLGFNLQYDIAVGLTHTDADKMLFAGTNTPVALVSIPLRYMHSSSEVTCLDDVEEIIELLAHFIVSLDEKPLSLCPLAQH